MNKFAEYTTQNAFLLALSRPQILTLLAYKDSNKSYKLDALDCRTLFALERKGLIEWQINDGEKAGPFITEAGEHVATLLKIAGFKLPTEYTSKPEIY